MFLHGIATITPPHSYSQMECFDEMKKGSWFSQLETKSQKLLERVLTGDSYQLVIDNL